MRVEELIVRNQFRIIGRKIKLTPERAEHRGLSYQGDYTRIHYIPLTITNIYPLGNVVVMNTITPEGIIVNLIKDDQVELQEDRVEEVFERALSLSLGNVPEDTLIF